MRGLELLKMRVLYPRLGQRLAERGCLFLGRSLVYTVHERNLLLPCELRRALVRGEHELLDDALGLAPLARLYVVTDAVLADDELALGRFKLGGVTTLLLRDEDVGKLVHQRELVRYRAVFLGDAAVGSSRKYGVYLRIYALYARADNALAEAVSEDIPLAVELRECRQSEPVLVGIERADAVRELLREHRYHLVGVVDARSAAHSLLVELAVSLDVV